MKQKFLPLCSALAILVSCQKTNETIKSKLIDPNQPIVTAPNYRRLLTVENASSSKTVIMSVYLNTEVDTAYIYPGQTFTDSVDFTADKNILSTFVLPLDSNKVDPNDRIQVTDGVSNILTNIKYDVRGQQQNYQIVDCAHNDLSIKVGK